MLLLQKKHLAFLWIDHPLGDRSNNHEAIFLGWTAVCIVFLFFLMTPAEAHAGFFSNLLDFFGYDRQEVIEEKSFLVKETLASSAIPALDSASRVVRESGVIDDVGLTVIQESALAAPLNPIGIIPDEHGSGQIFVYTVRPGDNPSAIAKSFGITLNTLLWANNLSNPRAIRPGDHLIILPISGVRVEIKKGETIESIAKQYKGNIEDILSYNGIPPDGLLAAGTEIIIPDGELNWRAVETSGPSRYTSQISRYPAYGGYYIRPISGGRKSRGIHGFNGVDLASSCGFPVVASSGGTVIISRSDGWNGGYGRYAVVSHANGTQTLYAHLKDVFVRSGQGVSQAQAIGTIGSTGNSTGCHVHFEVRGAQNPF